MLRNLYIATSAPRSGKCLVLLGIMEMLSRRVEKLGIFRPVITQRERPDNDIELVRQRYGLQGAYESLYGMTHQEATALITADRTDEFVSRVYGKYKALERQCDFVVCEGTDLTGVAAALEFDLNALIANQIGAPVVVVANGRDKTTDEIRRVAGLARESFEDERCTILATLINRLPPDMISQLKLEFRYAWPHHDPVYFLPEEENLGKPTIGQVALALDAYPLFGTEGNLNKLVRSYKVAAMELANFLGHIEEGCLVITPGDRSDLVIGTLAAFHSSSHPKAAGIFLTGGFQLNDDVRALIEGMGQAAVPIFCVECDTYETAWRASNVIGAVTPGHSEKIAAALGLFENHVDIPELEKRIELTRSNHVTPIMFQYELVERAQANKQRIVLPEGKDERILKAASILLQRDVVDITILGDPEDIRNNASALGLNIDRATLINPADSPCLDEYAQVYYALRKHKGVTEEQARDIMLDVSYYGTMMVYQDAADAMVSGAAHTTGHTIRPAFEFVKMREGRKIVSSVFFMCLEDRVLVYGDCAVNPNPSPEQLADIAIASAETAQTFGVDPMVAMLSYSSGASGKGEDVDKVRAATKIAQELRPDLKIEGPIQYDAAVDLGVGKKKMPESEVAGRATVFIFPDLNTGNNTYKAVQRSANAIAIGPVLQGLRKPVNDLSRGCLVADIVNTVAITAIQAQNQD